MKRYLSTLACSGLLSIGALCGGAFAASLPSSIPGIVPTVNAVGEAFRALPAQPVNSGIHGILLHKQNDDPGGLQFVRGGGGGGGGGHGGGGMGGGGTGGNSAGGMGGNSAGGSGVGGGGVGGGGFFGFGRYPRPYCNPYYGPCYPGYRRGY
ncbi:hypothetical protein M2281_002576 [Mesorhizobium soli]|uniref:hypothetical protein n=1 Tax=Pseudaminobacter soli (ex Li et al. 2025) TaxID=1295366 RepID=UPI00247357AA|nr:hypothetical protein [Mesorhizobium soli]MDH6231978.1 hypothetical protein [Mesorhizobium soli]